MHAIVGRGYCRVGSLLLVAGLWVGLLPVSEVQAQSCTRVNPPVLNFEFQSASGSTPGGSVTADGRIAMLALPNDAPDSAAAELAFFNPRSGQLQYVTSGTLSQVDLLGVRQRFVKRITGVSRGGNLVALSGSAQLNFPFLQLPGTPAPAQVTEVLGLSGLVELVNTQTGTRQTIGSLSSQPLNSNEFYIGQVSGFTANASKLLLDEFIVRFDLIEVDGQMRRIVPTGGFVASASGLFDVASGQFVANINQQINALVGGQASLFSLDGALIRMSGDGNAFVFASERKLEDPQRPFWRNITPANGRVNVAPYVYFAGSNQILPVVDINTNQPRVGGSSFAFLRNIGLTGTAFGIERGVSYIGAPANPSGANNPATLVLGQVPQYITPPSAQPPVRGFFANSFSLISPEEDRVYFQHTSDLVTGNNPNKSQEIFSIQLSNRQIRQISRHLDPLAERFATEPNLLFQYGDVSQIIYAGSSTDHSVVAYTYTNPGGSTRTVKEIDAQGRTTLRAARFGTAEYPASEIFRIMLCQ